MGEGVSVLSDEFECVTGTGVPVPRGPYSPAVVRGDLVFVSGLLAVKPDGVAVSGDVREEAMIVLRNLKNLLESAGSGLESVLSVTVYLGDIADLAAFNEVYEEFFKPPYPSRSAVGVSLLRPFQIQLSAIACLDQGGSDR
jgi:2-iminobutanoate/2-iminopropanoate deaminase